MRKPTNFFPSNNLIELSLNLQTIVFIKKKKKCDVKPNDYYSGSEKSTKYFPQASVGWQGLFFFLSGSHFHAKEPCQPASEARERPSVKPQSFG